MKAINIIGSLWNAEGGVPYNVLSKFVRLLMGARCAPLFFRKIKRADDIRPYLLISENCSMCRFMRSRIIKRFSHMKKVLNSGVKTVKYSKMKTTA